MMINEIGLVNKVLKEQAHRLYGVHISSTQELQVTATNAPSYGQDVVEYTITNPNNVDNLCVLYRGVQNLAPPYFFGNAFYAIYVGSINGAGPIAYFANASQLKAPLPASETDEYPLAVLNTGTSDGLPCFIFAVPAGGSIKLLEGGIPDASQLIDMHAYIVTASDSTNYCITYSQEAVAQYEMQTGTIVNTPTDPFNANTVLMTAVEPNIPSNEVLPGQYATAGQCPQQPYPCQSQIEKLIQDLENGTFNPEDITNVIICMFNSGILTSDNIMTITIELSKKVSTSIMDKFISEINKAKDEIQKVVEKL